MALQTETGHLGTGHLGTGAAPHAMRIDNLQVARAIGSIAVILFHAIPSTGDYGFRSDWLFRLSGWGYQGVDLFFVISGFVLILTETRRSPTAGAFLLVRLGRIAPTYWLLTTLLFLLLLSFSGLFRSMSADPALYLQSMSFTTFLFSPNRPPVIFVGWTLEYEMLLYLVFAATLFIRGWSRRLLLGTGLLIILVLARIGPPLLFEFMFGQVCGMLHVSGWRLPARNWLLAIGIIGLCLPQPIEMQWHALRCLFYGMPAALVILAISQMPQSRNRLLILIGNASYSIYLIQVFTIAFFCKLFSMALPKAPAELVVLVTTIGTVLAGLVLYGAFEKPVAGAINRLRGKRGRTEGAMAMPGPQKL